MMSAGDGAVPATFFARYEAESPLNVLTYPVEQIVHEGVACPAGGLKEGANCSSAGEVVGQILGRSPCAPPTSTTSYAGCQDLGGGVLFHGITVPANATYAVTVWYHSGQEGPGRADVFGDKNCGGLDYGTGPGSGCRPHMLFVNGVAMTAQVGGQTAAIYQFPAYPSAWSLVHGAVILVPLQAGVNTLLIKAPGHTQSDAVDLDAIDVQPAAGAGAPAYQASGHGAPPTLPIGIVTPVVNWN
jgi:hypothetical protein